MHRLFARILGAMFVVLPFAPGLLGRVGLLRAADALDRGWAPLCHRIPERCLEFLGAPMPICSRCLGLALGLGLGLLFAWPKLPLRSLVVVTAVAAALLALELITQEIGLHRVFHPTRLLSGLLLAYPIGAAAGSLAGEPGAPAKKSLFHEARRNRRGLLDRRSGGV